MKHRKAKWIAEAPVAENARRELPLLVEEYFAAGRKLAARRSSAARMHEFRLLTKHLRYTLEVFRPAYGPAMERYLGQLKKVQTVLGELNDYAATRDLMEASPDARHPDTRVLLHALAGREEEKRKEFAAIWTEFDADGQQSRWERYLRTYGRHPKAEV